MRNTCLRLVLYSEMPWRMCIPPTKTNRYAALIRQGDKVAKDHIFGGLSTVSWLQQVSSWIVQHVALGNRHPAVVCAARMAPAWPLWQKQLSLVYHTVGTIMVDLGRAQDAALAVDQGAGTPAAEAEQPGNLLENLGH